MDDWATAPLPATTNIALRKPNVKNVTVDAVRLFGASRTL